jgi:ribonucleoside-diphosphate reductase alpha chain
MLINLGIPYGSEKGRILAQDLVMFINYHSKLGSHKLALERGSFNAMNLVIGCRYNESPGFLEQKYGYLDTKWIKADEWRRLGDKIRSTRKLRHCSTVALPPTGRSALVINASTGIEPIFHITGGDGNLLPSVAKAVEKYQNNLSLETENFQNLNDFCKGTSFGKIVATSLEIPPIDQVLMLSHLQSAVDEAISKTINLPHTATLADIEEVYMLAYTKNLKGITIYRDRTHSIQPKKI